MKRLLAYLFIVLGLGLVANVKADDSIQDFQIEGMSIGDSAVNYFSKKILIENQKDWFKGGKYSISADLKPSLIKNYDSLQLVYLTNDKKFKLKGIEAIKFFQYDIDKCYSLFDEVSTQIQTLFSNITVSKKSNFKHSYDKSGKTTVTQQDLIFPNNDSVSIFCEDWSKETNFTDALRISIRTSSYKKFLLNIYN